MTGERLQRLLRVCELPIGLLALAVVPALILEDRATVPAIRTGAHLTNWIVWLAFCGEFLGGLAAAPKRLQFVRRSWFDLAIIVLSPPFLVPWQLASLRAFRAVRLVRFFRFLRVMRALAMASIGVRLCLRIVQHKNFHYVIFITCMTIGLGAVAIYGVEQGVNQAVNSLGDALWFAVVTTTTVGYGDVSPVTWEGRLIAVILMLVGIAVIGVFTATVASFFFEHGKQNELSDLTTRLAAIEAKLDGLIRRQDKVQ